MGYFPKCYFELLSNMGEGASEIIVTSYLPTGINSDVNDQEQIIPNFTLKMQPGSLPPSSGTPPAGTIGFPGTFYALGCPRTWWWR